ncbi:MAG: hypothetical protein Barrevirus1_54 [Barrevirus sp.]|uniref:Uncharacterized protein n=1 Tax=Barrevirus sp. TaxID=2487763 RepID=A0A3G4ZPK5_9VIRU|nr:MAG: hypothetical protein Barrevirus1_54 [Barrevirus sp.]
MSESNVSPSAPPLCLMDDKDLLTALDNPAFLDKLETVLRKREIKKADEQEKRIKAENQIAINNKRMTREYEMSLLGKIIGYIWLLYLFVILNLFLIYFFSDHILTYWQHDIIKNISSNTLSYTFKLGLTIAVPFFILMIFAMILFADF